MGKKSAPPPPDYTAAAEKQGESSLYQTQLQTTANRPDINTPWGSQTWEQQTSIDPVTGKPVSNWTTNIILSPEQQAALDSQMAIQQGRSEGALALLDRAVGNFQGEMDWSSVPQGADRVQAGQLSNGQVNASPLQMTLNGSAGDYRQRAQQAVEQLLQPGLQQRRSALETQLANQGITRGSEAWENAMREQNDAETRAQLQAIAAGRDEANSLFSQDLSSGLFANQAQGQEFQQLMAAAQRGDQNAINQLQMQIQAGNFNNANRQQSIAEETLRRNQTLNELNALLTGQQVQSPNMPSFNTATKADPTNYLGAAQSQWQSAMDASNFGQAGIAGLTNGLFSLSSAALNNPYGWTGLFNF